MRVKYFEVFSEMRKQKEGTANPAFEGDQDECQRREKDECQRREKGKKRETVREEERQTPTREKWDSPVEFLLSCVSMSVGLGNVWRFPFTAYENGGGAFLIPYFVVLFLVGRPLYYMELLMGQFASYGPVRVWEIVPAFRGVGYGQACATLCVCTYYTAIIAFTVFYFFASFASTLPWSECPPELVHCIDHTTNISNVNISATSISAAEVFYVHEVLKKHPHGLDDGIYAPEWRLSLCLLLVWVIIFFILAKGVKSSGKSAYFTALFPYVVLLILLARGVTLPGAEKGIKYFITPKWEKLFEPAVWYAAVSQCFFSLNVGFGTLIMLSSFNKFRHNVYRDALIISVTDTLTSLLAGFTIFSILGHLADRMGVDDIDLVIKGGGASLAFVSYPDVLTRFEWMPQLFSILFFLMLFTLGIGSAVALSATLVTIICDEFQHFRRSLVTLLICVLGFFLGLFYVTPQGSYILHLVDHYGATFIVYILAFLEVIAVQWFYGYSNFTRDIEFMLGRRTGPFWAFCWVVFTPLLLSVVFVYRLVDHQPLTTGTYVFGDGANGFGLGLTLVAIGMVPAVFAYTFFKNTRKCPSVVEAFKQCFRPSAEWSPMNPGLRVEYKVFKAEKTVITPTGRPASGYNTATQRDSQQ